MFAKVELWLVLLLLLITGAGGLAFAGEVLHVERATTRPSAMSRAALALAEMPGAARDLLRQDKRRGAPRTEVFTGKPTGWSFPSGPMTAPNGYLLLSRLDGAADRPVVELQSLPDMKVRYRWLPDVDAMVGMITAKYDKVDQSNWDKGHFRTIHPWPLPDGDLIVKDHGTPLWRIDACGRPKWMIQSRRFHHSTEGDADGNLWIPSVREPPSIPHVRYSFFEDQIVKVSPEGRVLYAQSVLPILLRHGYGSWFLAADGYNDDVTHLNDIQPVLADGPYWKKGDVFLSLRNLSTIMLYRPATDEIVWIKRGPWRSQHDVDMLDDHRISVYDNEAQDLGTPPYSPFVEHHSRILVYDFATGQVTAPLDAVMAENDMKTESAGLFTALPGGSSMIEDTTNSRFFIARPDGRLAAEYVNRAPGGDVLMLGWSRYLAKPEGDALLQRLRQVKCAA